jgi:hypothetical protein
MMNLIRDVLNALGIRIENQTRPGIAQIQSVTAISCMFQAETERQQLNHFPGQRIETNDDALGRDDRL